MKTPVAKPLPPTLPDVLKKGLDHPVATLLPGDNLHLKAKALGFPKGASLPVYGYCTLFDEDDRPYCTTAYVRPWDMAQAVPFSERDAVRFRFDNQKEEWFGERLMYLVPVDLTDYADVLKLERQPVHVAEMLCPEAPLRLAA